MSPKGRFGRGPVYGIWANVSLWDVVRFLRFLVFALLLISTLSPANLFAADEVVSIPDELRKAWQALNDSNFEGAIAQLYQPARIWYDIYKKNPTKENEQLAFNSNYILGIAYEKSNKGEAAIAPYRRALSVRRSTDTVADMRTVKIQSSLIGIFISLQRIDELRDILKDAKKSAGDVYGKKSGEALEFCKLYFEVSYRTLSYEEAIPTGDELLWYYSQTEFENEAEVNRVNKILTRMRYYADEVKKLKKETGYVCIASGIPQKQSAAWINAHPLASGVTLGEFGDSRDGILKDLLEMKLPPYVLESKPSISIGRSTEMSLEEGVVQQVGSKPEHITISFQVIVKDDFYRNMKWDMQLGVPSSEIFEDYSQVLGWALAKVFVKFPEIVQDNQIVLDVEYQIQSESARSKGESEKIRLSNPLRVQSRSIQSLKETKENQEKIYVANSRADGAKPIPASRFKGRNYSLDTLSDQSLEGRGIESYYEELEIEKR